MHTSKMQLLCTALALFSPAAVYAEQNDSPADGDSQGSAGRNLRASETPAQIDWRVRSKVGVT